MKEWAFTHWENGSIDGRYSANDPLAAERRKIKEDLERYMNSHGMTVKLMDDMEGGDGRGFDHQNDQDRDP